MKTYNTFNEMFNANKSVKSDLSVFNVKFSADTRKIMYDYEKFCEEAFEACMDDDTFTDSDDYDVDSEESTLYWDTINGSPLQKKLIESICNDFFLPENQKEYALASSETYDPGICDSLNKVTIYQYVNDVAVTFQPHFIDINIDDLSDALKARVSLK